MKIRKIVICCLVVCCTTLFFACEVHKDADKLLVNKWQCCSYKWKYFDDERTSFTSHLNASNDSSTRALYNDSLKILNIFEEKAKSVILQFNADRSSLIMFQGGTMIDSLRGKWKLFAYGKRLFLPSYPQGDTLTIEKLSLDSFIFIGIERAEPFKVVCKSVK